MNRHGLRTRILLFSILPLLIIGSGLFTFSILNSYSQLNSRLVDRSRMIIYPLSTNISFAMGQQNLPLLQGLINEAHQSNSRDILAISVFDKDNNMLATSSIAPETSIFKLNTDENEHIYPRESVEYSNDGIIMRMPIYAYDTSALLTLYGNTTDLNDLMKYNQVKQLSYLDPKLDYPRPVIGYVCVYFLRNQTLMAIYNDISIAVILFVFGLAISLIFGLNLNRIIVDPINKISTAIYEIREGNVDTKVNGTMLGELERLRSYINSMANSMAESHNEMQYSVDLATNDLRLTLDKLDTQNKELEDATNRAIEASKVKSEFLANMSHELRTPLNGIIGFTKQLNKSQLKNSQQEYLDTIERSAKNLLSIVNNIMDFSKLEAGKLLFESIPFSLRSICYDTVKLLSPVAYEKEIEITVTIAKDVQDYIIGDPIRVQQILTNLLGNALKFTSKGNVALSISNNPKQPTPTNGMFFTNINFSVKDTGIGISTEQKQNLFSPFTQADSSISRRYGGTGLGLVITRHIVEQMQGAIDLTSEPGQGTEFTFNLVLQKGILPTANIDNRLNLVKKKKIVLIESNTWVRDSIKTQLENWALDVITISSTTPFNSINKKDIPQYLLLGLPHSFDQNLFYNDFSSLNTEKIERIIIAVNSIEPKTIQYLQELSPKIIVISKPIEPQKLLNSLIDPIKELNTLNNNVKLEKNENDNNKLNNNINSNNTNNEEVITSANTSIISNSNKVNNLLPNKATNNKLKAKILAVDDNPTNIMLIKTLLSELVTEVLTASDGIEAVEMCLNTEFDLIFMDIQMPQMDGITATRTIKKGKTNAYTPIIAVTALVIESEVKKFYQEGMAGYLAKPLDEKQLAKTIYKFCDKTENNNDNNHENEKSLCEISSSPIITSQEKIEQIPQPNNTIEISNIDNRLWTKEQALKMAANKLDLAKEMLKGLVDSLPQFITDMENRNNLEPLDFAKIVHKFAGSAVYAGMPRIKSICNVIETALKEGQELDDIEPELLELEDMLEDIKQNSKNWFDELD